MLAKSPSVEAVTPAQFVGIELATALVFISLYFRGNCGNPGPVRVYWGRVKNLGWRLFRIRVEEVLRADGRRWDEARATSITPGYQKFAEGSALIETGLTRVLCSASLEERVPPFLRGQGQGWVTAEYSMLPRSTSTRTARDREAGRISGRSQEIQRLIGRSLRAVADLEALGERTVQIDCDVIQADGGTRTAAITGAYVALYQAMKLLVDNRVLLKSPLRSSVAAISVGLVDCKLMLDLCYREDFQAQVDFSVVLTDRGEMVELQGATEAEPFPQQRVAEILSLASRGVEPLFQAQREAIGQL